MRLKLFPQHPISRTRGSALSATRLRGAIINLSRNLFLPECLIVESENSKPWQIPGSVRVDTLGVSAGGSRVAFDGTYKPPATALWLSGLFHADSKANEVTRIAGSCGTTSISWSPDGNAFAYDCRGYVSIFHLREGQSTLIGEGSTPSWSPDGHWIAFRLKERAAAIDLTTMKTKPLMAGRTIQWGIHWSPDSRYVMASQRVGLFEAIVHWNFDPLSDAPAKIVIERLEDGAISDRLWFPVWGEDDRGYYWITNYQALLKRALLPAAVKPCP